MSFGSSPGVTRVTVMSATCKLLCAKSLGTSQSFSCSPVAPHAPPPPQPPLMGPFPGKPRYALLATLDIRPFLLLFLLIFTPVCSECHLSLNESPASSKPGLSSLCNPRARLKVC